MNCDKCKYWSDNGPAFGEPRGTCQILNYFNKKINENKINWNIKTGPFQECELQKKIKEILTK